MVKNEWMTGCYMESLPEDALVYVFRSIRYDPPAYDERLIDMSACMAVSKRMNAVMRGVIVRVIPSLRAYIRPTGEAAEIRIHGMSTPIIFDTNDAVSAEPVIPEYAREVIRRRLFRAVGLPYV